MAGYISPEHADAKEQLIVALRVYIRHTGGISKAAAKTKMQPRDLAAILRLDRSVSLSKLQDIGKTLGLKLVMKWEPKNGA